MNERLKSLLIYAAKCVVGTIIILSISHLSTKLTYSDTIWSLFSVLLILSPDGKDSFSLAVNRIKANLLGAGIGLAFITLFPNNLSIFIICFALVCTLALGYYFKLDSGIRSALVATIIVIMPQSAIQTWSTPIARVISVIAGCVLGILITYIFHFKEKNILGKNKSEEA